MLPTARPVIWVVVLAVGYPLGIGASSAQAQVLSSAQALGSVSPAPAPADPATCRTSQPGRALNATPQLTIRRSAPAPSQHDSDQPATLAPQRHIADRPTRPVQSLDDRHGVAPILCRRTLRPRHDALSHPRSAIARCPRCFSRWSRSSPRRAYPTHGGPAEQSARRSRSSASVGVVALVVQHSVHPPALPRRPITRACPTPPPSGCGAPS
jgi:hypothetical protein